MLSAAATAGSALHEVPASASVAALAQVLAQATQPLVLRALVADWPLVRAGLQAGLGTDLGTDLGTGLGTGFQAESRTNLQTSQAVCSYLRGFYRGATVDAWLGDASIEGRFFYNDDFTGFNFRPQRLRLDDVLDQLLQQFSAPRPGAIYVGSTTIDTCLPGLRAANPIDLGPRDALVSLWLGNRTRIAAHQDLPHNLACVAAGRRRFTLFPPDQVGNLYIGPLDLTPAGQAISLVDFAQPDWARFPRFEQALQHALVAELDPGDAVFIPSLWWHHIEALDPFNVLVNCWWRDSPAHMDSPMNALMHTLMSVRDLPAEQRQAWAQLFEHYVFGADENTAAHIPPHARGVLAPLDDHSQRVLRARLLKKLNR